MKGNRQQKFKKVDMNMVHTLTRWREEKNHFLIDTKLFCNLKPDKRIEPCCSCEYYKDCYHHRWEREYIHKKKQREREIIRKKRKSKKHEKHIIFVSNSHHANPCKYVCDPYEFACPENAKCGKGKHCPWS